MVELIDGDNPDGLWNYKKIIGHQGPLRPSDPKYKGSVYNLMVLWETGEIGYEPLKNLLPLNKANVAFYAGDHGLLNEPGFKQLKKLARREKMCLRLQRQAQLHSYRTTPIYMYGYLVPRNHQQAVQLDEKNGNTKWKEAEKIELNSVLGYGTFNDYGHGAQAPQGYKKIRVRFVYAVKHDGRYKARLVAGGHLTDEPIDSVYSSVASLRGV